MRLRLGGYFSKSTLSDVYRPLYAGFDPGAEVITFSGLLGLVCCNSLYQLHHEAMDGLTYYHQAYLRALVQDHYATGHQGAVCRPWW